MVVPKVVKYLDHDRPLRLITVNLRYYVLSISERYKDDPSNSTYCGTAIRLQVVIERCIRNPGVTTYVTTS